MPRRHIGGILDCKNDKISNIKIDLIGDSPFHLRGSFPGPEGTPYQGGTFEVVSSSHFSKQATVPSLLACRSPSARIS